MSTHPTPPPEEPQAPAEAAGPDETAHLRHELQAAKDALLRTLADVDNTKKRLAREKEEFSRFAAERVIRDLLPIVDSLDQALVKVDSPAGALHAGGPAPHSDTARHAAAEAVIRGVHLIYRQLLGVLQKEGVTRIPTVGERFDPHRHEAVAHVEAANGQADETIVEEVQTGYTLHQKVIRPAMVKVAKASDQRPETGDQSPATGGPTQE